MVGTYTEGDEPIPGFQLSQLLGWGRFGEVWKASGPGGITVAVKIIPLSSRQGLKEFRAIRLVKQIRHPNLVPIMAFWLKDRQGNFIDDSLADDAESMQLLASELIIVMGLGEKSLHDRLLECIEAGYCGIPLEELLGYMLDAARAIDYLNRRAHLVDDASVGIQHCDIKPHNILIVGGVVQLCDLGVARVLEDTRASAATGSAAYIAPEFIQTGKPSSATDQYSLAVTYVELRTGLLPFVARSAAAAYLVHLNGELDFSGLSVPEREVIVRATARAPEDRFPTCLAFVKALEEACSRIPLEERAIVNGVARLNASGLIAGERSTAAGPNRYGPFHTAPIDELGEDLALSDEEESMAAFARRGSLKGNASFNDETAEVAFRSRVPDPESIPEPLGNHLAETSRLAVPASPVRLSVWNKLTQSYNTNMEKLRSWRAESRGPSRGTFGPKKFWNDLTPSKKKWLRYGSQLGLLAVLGIAAGQATSPFSAAEKAGPNTKANASTEKKPGAGTKRDRKPTDSRYESVVALRDEGKFAEALDKLNKVIAAQPDDSLGYLYRAELETSCGQLPEALEDSNRALKDRSADPAVHACRARIFLAKGEYYRALNECDRVLNYDLQNPNVLYMRSQALSGIKQYGLALSVYRDARKMLPRAVQPSTGLAVGRTGLTVDACKGADLKSRLEIWRDRTDSSPKLIDGGPAFALAPDGHTLAYGADKHEIRIADLTEQRPALSLKGHTGPITKLIFCREGRWLASASDDRTIKVWNVVDGAPVYSLEGHSKTITALAYSPSEDLLASGSADQTICLWDLKQGTCRQTLTGHQAVINALAFAPLGRLLASGSSDRLIKLWDSASGTEVGTLAGHSAEVTSLAFNNDGRMLASGSADLTWPLWPGQVKLWDIVSGTPITTFGGHPHGVYQLAFDPDGARLVSAGADFELRSWDVAPFSPNAVIVKK